MPIRKYKPTSPGRRFQTVQVFDEITTDSPVPSADRDAQALGRPQQHRRADQLVARRRAQAPLPGDRLQARQEEHPGDGVDHRVRPEPLGAHRPGDLRRRREALHAAAAGHEGGRHHHRRRHRRHPAGQRPVARPHPPRHARPQRRAEAGPRWPAGPQRRRRGAGGGQGRRIRLGQDAVGRDSQDPAQLPGHHRPGRQPRSRERVDRQGRPQPLAGPEAARPRGGHEPGRPPARRRRGPHLRRPSPGDAVGRADQGLQDPLEQEAEQPVHRAEAEEGRG